MVFFFTKSALELTNLGFTRETYTKLFRKMPCKHGENSSFYDKIISDKK